MHSVVARLLEWNQTQAAYPDRGVHELFEAQAARTPRARAVSFRGEHLTYEELNARANQLARHLRGLGVGRDVLVGICMYRCLEMIVGVLATLKAGGAYVPLDPTYPRARLATMFADVGLTVLLTTDEALRSLPEHAATVVCLDHDWPLVAEERADNLPPVAGARDLAYVIFTSGSTGRAKAAAVMHQGWTNLMHWFATALGVSPADRVLVISSFSFDITQRSLVMPLIRGAELHLSPSHLYDPVQTRHTIEEQAITLVNCSPSMFYLMIEKPRQSAARELRSLRTVILGGEAISASRVRGWAESEGRTTEILNVYGVAECSDVSTVYKLTDYQRYVETSVPIGKPIFNSQVYLLDDNLDPVPFGGVGQICLAGDGVGRGYINDEAMTSERFIANPFSDAPGARLYKTGDLGRLLPDWNLEFVGRIDYQVKVRGLRIELGDIETALRQHEAIDEAVVMSEEGVSGDVRLVAYVSPRRPGLGPEVSGSLRAFLRERLPLYMVPTEFVIVAQMPLNPNGKIDRRSLRHRA